MLVDCRLTVETAGPSSRDGGTRQYSGSGTRQWIRQDLDVDTARPGCGGGETRQYKDSGTRQWMASLGLYAEAVALFQHFLMAYYRRG